ncbi:MAG: hypothetical protein KC502_12280 [Myxococcales bacterium]|nr:hypothetical protein [Myxococcales bacterium]
MTDAAAEQPSSEPAAEALPPDFGPARVGAQQYAWRTTALHSPSAVVHDGAVAAATTLLEDERRLEDQGRLQQRAILLELGESDRLIPWHDRALDARALADAQTLLVLGHSLLQPVAPLAPADAEKLADGSGPLASAGGAEVPSKERTAAGQACLAAAAQTLALIHADTRLHDDSARRELAIAARLAQLAASPELVARLLLWLPEQLPQRWEACFPVPTTAFQLEPTGDRPPVPVALPAGVTPFRWVATDQSVAGPFATWLAAEQAHDPKCRVLHQAGLADGEAALSAELAAEGQRQRAARSLDLAPDSGAELTTGTLIWTGQRIRLALNDTRTTLLPNFVVTGAQQPQVRGRTQAMACAAWRLAARGAVIVVCSDNAGVSDAADMLSAMANTRLNHGHNAPQIGPYHRPRQRTVAMDPAVQPTNRRAARIAARMAPTVAALRSFGVAVVPEGHAEPPGDLGWAKVVITTPRLPLARWPTASAIVVTRPSWVGQPLPRRWLQAAAATLGPWPRPLLLVGINGSVERQRVTREAALARDQLQPGLEPTPLAQLLAAALPDPVPSGLLASLHQGDTHQLGEHAPWVQELLATARRCGLTKAERSAAWRSTRNPYVRSLLSLAWGDDSTPR